MAELTASREFWRRAFVYAVSEGVPRRSLLVALVVGTILNLINQGDALVLGQTLNIAKLALTYVVPYLVSTYGAVSFRMHAARSAARLKGNQDGFDRACDPV
jgi:hypothetical protein